VGSKNYIKVSHILKKEHAGFVRVKCLMIHVHYVNSNQHIKSA